MGEAAATYRIEKEELEGTMDEMEKRIDALEGEGEEKK